MYIEVQNVSVPLEPDEPVEHSILDGEPATQEYINSIPTMRDLLMQQKTPGVLPPSSQTITYFIGKLIYDSIGRRRENEFCIYIVRADEASKEAGIPPTPGDPNYVFMDCPKWNATHEDYRQKP